MTESLHQGDLGLLETDVARKLLTELITARIAYIALDGTPRVVPINFHWTGEEVVMGGFATSAKSARCGPTRPSRSRSTRRSRRRGC
ncbi:hypothetical protein [Actinophytocola sp.]|uniref:hypothetical protein n=1 Tax=Actinophytocola sp. TaxID=1872138 RepID=UPI0025B954BC|nr:hypothetical protein [Actinophytocola sp.]